MNASRFIVASLTGLLFVSLFFAEGASVAKGDPPSKDAIDTWIRQLGDPRYTVRESAKRALITAGPHAMAAVLQAAKSLELEVKRRAVDIAKQIEVNAAKELEA